ncbi:MAG: hypothetical protein WKF84_19195 [Pyrinomonadaceae bacterium]
MRKDEPITLWEKAREAWAHKDSSCRCEETCWCPFEFVCTACSDSIQAIGEDMPEYVRTGGQCVSCFYFDDEGNPL